VTRDDCGGAQISITGRPAQVEAASARVCAVLDIDPDNTNHSQMQQLEDPSVEEEQHLVPPQHTLPQEDTLHSVVRKVSVPTDSLAYLIGKRGAVIKRVRVDSKCHKIHICDEENGNGADPITNIEIDGSESATRTAIKLIEEIVQQHQAAEWKKAQSLTGGELTAQGSAPDAAADELERDVYADYRDLDYRDLDYRDLDSDGEATARDASWKLAAEAARMTVDAVRDSAGAAAVPQGTPADARTIELAKAEAAMTRAAQRRAESQEQYAHRIREAEEEAAGAKAHITQLEVQVEELRSQLDVATKMLEEAHVSADQRAAAAHALRTEWEAHEVPLAAEVTAAQMAVDSIKALVAADVARLEAAAEAGRRALRMATGPSSANLHSASQAGDSCCVCMASPRTHIIAPCGHRCLCAGCAEKFGPGTRCPLCQQTVQMCLHVYE